jgi:hypothetical protein
MTTIEMGDLRLPVHEEVRLINMHIIFSRKIKEMFDSVSQYKFPGSAYSVVSC